MKSRHPKQLQAKADQFMVHLNCLRRIRDSTGFRARPKCLRRAHRANRETPAAGTDQPGEGASRPSLYSPACTEAPRPMA